MKDVSIIISTWNNSKRLSLTLESFRNCRIPEGLKWELVLVNNNCTDDTDEVAGRFLDKLPIVYVKEPLQGLSRARNKGLETAQGELILFTDDDVKPCREWIITYWSAYQEKPSGYFFGGPIESEFESRTAFDNDLLMIAPESVKGLNLGEEVKILPREYFIAANWACPASTIRELGSFDISKGLNVASGRIRAGEETGLMDRLRGKGWKACYLPEAKIKHFVPLSKCSLKHIAGRCEAYGYELSEAHRYTGKTNTIHGVPLWIYKKIFSLWIIWVWNKILNQKGYREYAVLRQWIGTARGLHESNITGT